MDKTTWFNPRTPHAVRRAIQSALADDATILRVFYGDPASGRDWCSEHEVVGFVGRSCGPQKVPLLLEPLRDMHGTVVRACGGGAMLADCVLRIIRWNDGRELYRAPSYLLPQLEISPAPDDLVAKGYSFQVTRDGERQAAFPSWEAAGEYAAFLQGFRIAREFRALSEYMQELREAA